MSETSTGIGFRFGGYLHLPGGRVPKNLQDMKIKMAKIEESMRGASTSQAPRKSDFVRRCIWCDSTDHYECKVCEEFQEAY